MFLVPALTTVCDSVLAGGISPGGIAVILIVSTVLLTTKGLGRARSGASKALGREPAAQAALPQRRAGDPGTHRLAGGQVVISTIGIVLLLDLEALHLTDGVQDPQALTYDLFPNAITGQHCDLVAAHRLSNIFRGRPIRAGSA